MLCVYSTVPVFTSFSLHFFSSSYTYSYTIYSGAGGKKEDRNNRNSNSNSRNNTKKKALTAEELDAEMDDYHNAR